MSEPDADYWLDHWGTCSMKVCDCNKAGRQWLGQMCKSWTPLGAKSHQELLNHWAIAESPAQAQAKD